MFFHLERGKNGEINEGDQKPKAGGEKLSEPKEIEENYDDCKIAIDSTEEKIEWIEDDDFSDCAKQPDDDSHFFNRCSTLRTIEQTDVKLQEVTVNYDEILENIRKEALEVGFSDIEIDSEPERLYSSLESFDSNIWEKLTLDEQKESMENLAGYITDMIGFENPPDVEYYNNEKVGDFGGYNSFTNTLRINEYMLYNSDEAADTIAHELWHAHQYECARNPKNALAYQYQYNFNNYIPPELGQEAYEEQLVEAEARAFASQFKDRLAIIKGRLNHNGFDY